MRAFILALLTLLMLPLAALAQSDDRPNTILVLDGSGSMWGQIDGVNKIVIARNVIAEMLAEMADEVSLGLTVYGHRQRGSCADIETIVEPAPFTQDRILEAVNAINPRGRTPMTDAVIAAAQSLRHTEEAATVILVSDGIENCNPDPCAIASELEATGVAFTAHVIGFDVASEPEARAQMQCIADNTGGQFLTADNAVELSAALEQVVEVVMPVQTTIEAVVIPQMVPPTRPVTWTLLDGTGANLASGVTAPAIQVELMPGDYVAQATRDEPDGPATYQTAFTVVEGGQAPVQVAMPPIIETSQLTFTARVEPDMSVPASPLNWTLFDSTGAAIVGPVAAPGGNVALLPGEYRIQVERVTTGTTHEAAFTMEANTPQEVIIPLPALSVDISLVARIGDVGGVTITDPIIWEVTPLDPAPEIATTNPATLPLTRGAYRVTAYWTVQEMEQAVDFVVIDQDREIIVVFPEPAATAVLTAPATAPAAAEIEVAWDGPGETGDMLIIRHPNNNVLLNVAQVRENPVTLRLPAYPGRYDITYRQNGGNGPIIGTAAIDVTDVAATLDAPDTIEIGEAFTVAWDGPGYPQDRIALVPAGETATRSNGRSVSFGNPTDLTAPTEPGLYELHYILREDERVIGTRPIEVVEVQASITAPDSAVAGSTLELGWTGPDGEGDFIGITAVDAEGYHRFANTARTNQGNPLDLLMPTTPGDYVLEYVLAEGRTRIVAVPITVTEAAATLTAPASATAGDTIEIGWTGPDYESDFIAITRVGSEGYHRFANTTRTNRGNPADLLMPTETGDYIIEYVLGQDRVALTTVPITVSDASATLTAPASAVAGSTVEIGWTGPDYENDFIAITRVGDEGYHRFDQTTRTNRGNPLDLLMPAEPGEYVLEYVLGQDRVALVTQPMTITELGATLTAPASATAGSTIEVGWTGPGYDNDFIGITRVGEDGYHRFAQTTRTNQGSPLDLLMPTQPGEYVLEYVLGQDRSALTTAPITITELGATITAPTSAVAGSTIEVGWTGPGYDNDFIGITAEGEDGYHRFAETTRTNAGSPLDLLMPTQPGAYVLEYVLGQDRTNLTTVPITVTAASATITAPATATAGSSIEIGWTGPNYSGDFIGLTREGEDGYHRFDSTARTSDGSPVTLVMPSETGNYVLEYVLGQDRTNLTTVPLEVIESDASLTAPATAIAGSTIEIAWVGPNNDTDYVGIGRVGASGSNAWETFAYTRDGSTLRMEAPISPGSYEISYFLGLDRSVLVTAPLEISAVEASVTAPASAVAGSTIEVGFTGPDYTDDYIGIGRVGAGGSNAWENWAYTRDGNPARVVVPATAGTYEITYFTRQDRTPLATTTIEVTAAEATLTAPQSVAAGSDFEVAWTGPGYDEDYLGMGLVGATGSNQWAEWDYTRNGNPARLTAPDVPGTYVIRYYMRQGRTPIAEVQITVQ